ncbi:hypothetical protein APHAL10511_008066 [Amanita phalloides]|nr:hypothetical protein APHAL10511_008066 [Amanita phalloides]
MSTIDNESDDYVEFGPMQPTLLSNYARALSEDHISVIEDNIPPPDEALLKVEVERLENEVMSLNREIGRLKAMKAAREHDLSSLKDQILVPRQEGAKVPQEVDYQHRYFDWSERLMASLKGVFKIEDFRLCQKGVCNAVMDRRDVFCVMPTGGGKSLTYQLPALLQDGCTLVISPLVALISDQVHHLLETGIDVVRITGATSEQDRRMIYRRLYAMADNTLPTHDKGVRLCYVTPEMVYRSKKFKSLLTRLSQSRKLARIAIDEAHCISELGHEFRKDYSELRALRTYYPEVPILALSATCPPRVVDDVLETLQLRGIVDNKDPRRTLYFSSPLYRKNLHYTILPKPESQRAAIGAVAKYILDKHPQDSGIIYCLRQKDSEIVSQELMKITNGQIKTGVYHAGRPDREKEHLHSEWRKGNIKVVCATIAFGLGIDKADVRFVLHHTVSKSIECYYQESGRAGRDGKSSDCVLFYRPQDATSLFALASGEKNGAYKVREMMEFSENLIECRKLLFAKYFSVASQLDPSSWTTEEVDASDPCGHCDNCLRPKDSIIERDVTQETWKLIKIAEDVVRPLTLKQLTGLARGNGNGSYGSSHGRKEKIDLKTIIGEPIKLKPVDSEHLVNYLMTQNYFKEKVEINEHTTNVYVIPGPAAVKLSRFSLEEIPKNLLRHNFSKISRVPSIGQKKRKRNVARSDSSFDEVEEVEKTLTLELLDEIADDDMDEHVLYDWSRSMCEPPPVKRRRQMDTTIQYVSDSENEGMEHLILGKSGRTSF